MGVDHVPVEGQGEQRIMVRSGAAIYASAAAIGLIEGVAPGGPAFSVLPSVAAAALAGLVLLVGPRVPYAWLIVLGLLGAALIGVSLATTYGYGDGAVLYMLPVLWTAYFFGRRGAVATVVWIGVVHGLALLAMPSGVANVDRWIDVVVSVAVVAAVVSTLSERNDRLVGRLLAEARVDPLTGLLNRRGLDERMGLELSRAARDDSPLGVVTLDLDHFKLVNDEHGHEIGDRVLAWVGTILQEEVRGVDVAARIGGEEFVVVLPRADGAGAYAFAERVRRAVAATGPESGRGRFGLPEDLELTISGGVISSTMVPLDAQDLLGAADVALYAAKRRGRNRTVIGGAPAGRAAPALVDG